MRRTGSATPLFNNVFLWQWLTDIPLSDVKYVEVGLGMVAGIGAVLAHYTRINNAFSQLGFKTVLKRSSTRYKDDMLEKYFNLDVSCPGSDETNTIYVTNTVPLVPTHFVLSCSANFDDSILSESFIRELKEYEEAVIGDKKLLGVLIRGTDYVVSKMSGTRKMATVDEMLPMIHEWMDEDGYDAIFLATEDQNVLDVMKEEFKGKIRVIAQERHRVSNFKGVTLISDLKKQERSSGHRREEVRRLPAWQTDLTGPVKAATAGERVRISEYKEKNYNKQKMLCQHFGNIYPGVYSALRLRLIRAEGYRYPVYE